MSATSTSASGGDGLPDTGPQDIHGVTVHDVPNLVASVMRICEELDIDSQEDGWADEIIARGAVQDTGQVRKPAARDARSDVCRRIWDAAEIAGQAGLDELGGALTVAFAELNALASHATPDALWDVLANPSPPQHNHDARGVYGGCPACGTDWDLDQSSREPVQIRSAYEADGSVYDEPPASTR